MTRIKTGNGQLVYKRFGNGKKALLAFHGFGQDKDTFKSWKSILGDRYTIYAFDLFYHGESDRTYGKLTKKEWGQYLSTFLEQENIKEFEILGFSLGGRFAIATALTFPAQTREIILAGPDGIFLTIWFKLATNPSIKWLFKYLMLNPDRLDDLIRFNEKNKLVNEYIADFVRKEMGNAENRKRVYISWNHFKSLGYRRSQLVKHFRKYSFKRRIILGDRDHIIRAKDILPIIEKMGGFEIDILPLKHHQLVGEEVAKLISR